MVVCLKQGADLHTAQLMPLPFTVSCFSKIQIDFTFLAVAHPGSTGQRAVKQSCVCVFYLNQYSINEDCAYHLINKKIGSNKKISAQLPAY